MHPFKKMIYMLRRESAPEPPVESYCVSWTAANNGNIKMETSGYIDFTAMLAGRTIMAGPASVGTITGYVIAGMSPFSCYIPMTFTTSKAQWNTDTLPVETDKVLTSLIYTINIIFNNASEFDIYDEQSNAVVISGQTTSEYNSCTLPLNSYYFEGFWTADDTVHNPDVNSWVNYKDEYGNTIFFLIGASENGCQLITASSIVSYNGCGPCTP